MINIQEKALEILENGKCGTFKEGRNEMYGDNDLKPCPFCGNEKTKFIDKSNEVAFNFAVNCPISEGGCGATGGYRESRRQETL